MMTTRRERNAEKVLGALRTHGPQDTHGLARLTGLSAAAVSQGIYFIRNNHPHYITVPTGAPWLYCIAPTMQAMVPGWVNQQEHLVTRLRSDVTRANHAQRLAVTPAEVAQANVLQAQATALLMSAEAHLALLKMML